MIRYIKRLLEQMRVNDDIRQIEDAIITLNILIEQNESLSAHTTHQVLNLVSHLEYDLENVTKEKH